MYGVVFSYTSKLELHSVMFVCYVSHFYFILSTKVD